jgi:hypothetical protein
MMEQRQTYNAMWQQQNCRQHVSHYGDVFSSCIDRQAPLCCALQEAPGSVPLKQAAKDDLVLRI